MMLVLTKDLELDRGKAGRARLGCVEGGVKVWWSGDDGKAVIEVYAWR
jgi:hypothetical protein